MRYIRTKDGRIIDTAKKSVALGYHPVEADNIEELCDCKVIVDNRFFPNPMILTMPLNDIIDVAGQNVYDAIYGAIFTDRGIIYVAKVNEKGDLVLI